MTEAAGLLRVPIPPLWGMGRRQAPMLTPRGSLGAGCKADFDSSTVEVSCKGKKNEHKWIVVQYMAVL